MSCDCFRPVEVRQNLALYYNITIVSQWYVKYCNTIAIVQMTSIDTPVSEQSQNL